MSSPLRVCHLGKYYPPAPGGIETYVQTLARAQSQLGVSVRVLCVNHDVQCNQTHRQTRPPWNFKNATATVTEADGPLSVTRLGRKACIARFDVCPGIHAALRSLSNWPVDVIHLHTPNPMMVLALSTSRQPAPLVITHHSDVIKQRTLRYALAPFEHMVYGRADRLLATSQAYIEGSSLLKQFRPKVDVVPLGLELSDLLNPTEKARDRAAAWRERCCEPMWLAVGRCVYYKGFETAIRALQHVRGTLVIIGTGPLRDSLAQLAKQLGVDQRVIWHGYADRDELIGAYLASTALWFPSTHRSEAFGLVQVEAMASGCPVINTVIPYSGVDWVSLNNETGLTVPIADPIAFAKAATRLLDEPGLRDRLSAAAVERASTEFNVRKMAQRTLDIYDSILHR